MGKLFIPNIVANGVLWLVGLAMQLGGWINQTIAIILLAIAVVWTIASIIWWFSHRNILIRNNRVAQKTGKQNGEIADKIDTLLIQIHERMLKLKDKAVEQYYQTHSINDFIDLHTTIMGTYKDQIEDINNISANLTGKKISKDNIKKREQIDNLFNELQAKVPTPQNLDELITFVNKVDRLATIPIKQNAYKGLDTRRNNDSKWKKLFKKIQQIKLLFNDHVLSIMIDDYLKWSYGISGCIWLTDLFRKISVDIIPTKYLESQAYNPNVLHPLKSSLC